MAKLFREGVRKTVIILMVLMLFMFVGGCSDDAALDDVTPDVEMDISTDYPDVDGSEEEYPDTDSSEDVDAAEEGTNWDFYNELATEFITAWASGDFDTAAAMFSDEMTQGFGAEGLRGAWDEITALVGDFVEIHSIENGEHGGYFISGVIMIHEESGFGWNVVFSEDGIINGLSSGGPIPLSQLMVNAYNLHPFTVTERDGFTDYTVILGESTDFPLNAIMSIPDGIDEPVPAVVIVHGSGAHDMDGTISGNKPYRDIAEFLAANGIAVIRHDKRNFAYGVRLVEELGGNFTVWHEAIEDAILAAELLRADPRIDENRVFIIGHSLGGILAPRIHLLGGDFAGLILMAATPRNLLDLFIEQLTTSVYASVEEGLIGEAEKEEALAQLAELSELFDSIADMSPEEARETHIPALASSAYYWKDMLIHSFADFAENVTVPILVMQGGSDFQVLPDVDFVLLQEIFAGHGDVTFKLYDGLNHMFMHTAAMNFVQHAESMQRQGYIDTQVLHDIADWIRLHYGEEQ